MELEGFIYKVMEPNSGVSQKTGNPWMSQEFVFGYYWYPNQTQPSYMVARIFGEDNIRKFDLHVNEECTIRFNIQAHESNERWFNEVRVTAVEKKYSNQAAQQVQSAQPDPQTAQPDPAPLPEAPKDDLPF